MTYRTAKEGQTVYLADGQGGHCFVLRTCREAVTFEFYYKFNELFEKPNHAQVRTSQGMPLQVQVVKLYKNDCSCEEA